MPQVQVVMLEGRTEEQKRRLARRITEVLEEEAGARREAVSVSFIEVPAENYASGGVLVADKRKSGG
jgi:4-oxalocrotonate tautomerase